MHPLVDAFIQGRQKFKKKEVGSYFGGGKVPKTACHLGAIWWATHKNTVYEGLLNDYPELVKHVPVPCGCDLVPDSEGEIRSLLIHLSDEHDGRSGWSDANVAAWLEKSLS